jgi:hypothetical protein
VILSTTAASSSASIWPAAQQMNEENASIQYYSGAMCVLNTTCSTTCVVMPLQNHPFVCNLCGEGLGNSQLVMQHTTLLGTACFFQ